MVTAGFNLPERDQKESWSPEPTDQGAQLRSDAERVGQESTVDPDILRGVVEQVAEDVGVDVSRERVEHVVGQVARSYRDASVTSFVPIFIRRMAGEVLRKERGTASQSPGSQSAGGSRGSFATERVPAR